MEIFKLFGSILVDNTEADKSIAKTDKQAESLGNRFLSGVGKAAKWGAAIGAAAIGAATAIAAVAVKGAESADRIDKLSQSLGFSREGFQEWDYILSQNGVSIDSLTSGMKTLTNQTDDLKKGVKLAEDSFGALGITYDDLAGKTQEEIFELTIQRLQQVDDATQRAAIGNDLLGRSALTLAPLLNSGAESVDNLKNKAQELGLVMSDDAVDAGVKLTDTMDTFKRSLSATLFPILEKLMPFAEKFLNLIMDNMPLITSALDTLFDLIVPVLDMFVTNIFPIMSEFLEMFMKDLLPPIVSILSLLFSSLLMPLMNLLSGPFKEILEALAKILIDLMPILIPIIDLLVMLLNIILPPLIKIITWLADVIQNVLGGAFSFISIIISGFVNHLKLLLNFVKNVFTGNWKEAWENIKDIFKNIFNTFADIALKPLNLIIKTINNVIKGLNKIPGMNISTISEVTSPNLNMSSTIMQKAGGTNEAAIGGTIVNQTINFANKEMSQYEIEQYQKISSQNLAKSIGV